MSHLCHVQPFRVIERLLGVALFPDRLPPKDNRGSFGITHSPVSKARPGAPGRLSLTTAKLKIVWGSVRSGGGVLFTEGPGLKASFFPRRLFRGMNAPAPSVVF